MNNTDNLFKSITLYKQYGNKTKNLKSDLASICIKQNQTRYVCTHLSRKQYSMGAEFLSKSLCVEDFSWSLSKQQFEFNSTFELNLMKWKCTQAVYWLWIDNIHNVMTRRKNVNLVTVVGFACDCEYKMKGKFQSRLHKLLLHFHVAQCISISSATYNLNSYVPRRFFTYQR